jgi:RND family efflux transporter MFP subunit
MKPSNTIRNIILSATALLMIVFLYACGKSNADTIMGSSSETVRPVKAVQLQPWGEHSTRNFPGIAKALQDTELSFRVGGPLTELNAEAGRYIEHDEVIAKIDPRDFKIQIKSLEARLDASKAKLAESQLQYRRYEQLIKEKAAAKATYDRIKATFEMAEAQVRADLENLENAKNALEDAVLYAPFSGYIDQQYVENHQIVAASQPIISMIDLSVIEVEVALPEDMLSDMDRFESYACRFDALPNKTFTARLKETGKQPNPSNRTYPMTLTIVDDEKVIIRPGMAAEVKISIAMDNKTPVFIVPLAAVGNDADRRTFAWIADPDTGRLSKKAITIHGFEKNGEIKISGEISANQWIVVAGVNALTEDQKIRLLALPSKSNVGNEL